MENPITSPIKKYLTIALITILVTATAGLGYLYHDADANFREADLARASLDIRYKQLTAELETKKKSDETTEAVIKDMKAKLELKTADVDKVGRTLDESVVSIKKKYEGLPQTDTNRRAQEQELSTARMSGLWLSYCLSNPSHERCKK